MKVSPKRAKHRATSRPIWHYPAILAAPPALVLFDVWEDAENITGMGRLARHESDGKSAATHSWLADLQGNTTTQRPL